MNEPSQNKNRRSSATSSSKRIQSRTSPASAIGSKKRRAISDSQTDGSHVTKSNASPRKRLKSEDGHIPKVLSTPASNANKVEQKTSISKSSDNKKKVESSKADFPSAEKNNKSTSNSSQKLLDGEKNVPKESTEGSKQDEIKTMVTPHETSKETPNLKVELSKDNNEVNPDSKSENSTQCTDSKAKIFVNKNGIKFEIGSRLEALDRLGKWYPAKIIGVDDGEKEILIHFERWNSRYDEWVGFESERLRPIVRTSGRNFSPKKCKEKFVTGEVVLARWTDRKMYPAKVTNSDVPGFLTVMFYDGIRKKIKESNANKLPPEMENTVIFPSASNLAKTSERSTYHPDKTSSLIETESKSTAYENADRLKKSRLIVGGKFQAKRKMDAGEKPTHKVNSVKVSETKEEKTTTVPVAVRPSTTVTDTSQHEVVQQQKVEPATIVTREEVAVPSVTPDVQSQYSLLADKLGLSLPDARKVARKEFVIEEDHNHFKCTYEKCGKSFRKEKLLQAHLKHYHGTGAKAEILEKQVVPVTKVVTPVPKVVVKKSVKTVKEVPVKETLEVPAKSEISPVPIKKEVEEVKELEVNVKLEPNLPSPVASKPTSTHKRTLSGGSGKNVRKRNKSDSASKASPSLDASPKIEIVASPDVVKDVIKEPKEEITVPNIKIPKTEVIKQHVRSPTKLKNSEPEVAKNRLSTESEKSTPVLTHIRNSKRRRLDTAESISSTVSIDSVSVHSEDYSVVDVERTPIIKIEPGVKKSRSRSRKLAHGSASDVIRDEIVNCSCGMNDENGFMVQCELCYAWQHGSCSGILKEDEVPEKYVCSACLNPKLGRESMRYEWDQDWYKKGEMARFNFLQKSATDQSSSTLSAHNLATSILSIKNVLHSLKYKLKIAQNKYHPDLDYFKQPWNKDCKLVNETYNVNDSTIDGTNMDAIVSAIGALGIPLSSLNQTFAANSNDPGMFFDPSFFPTSKPQDPNPVGSYYPCSSNSTLAPSTSGVSAESSLDVKYGSNYDCTKNVQETKDISSDSKDATIPLDKSTTSEPSSQSTDPDKISLNVGTNAFPCEKTVENVQIIEDTTADQTKKDEESSLITTEDQQNILEDASSDPNSGKTENKNLSMPSETPVIEISKTDDSTDQSSDSSAAKDFHSTIESCDQTAMLPPKNMSETNNVNNSDSDTQKLETKDVSVNSAVELCDQTTTLQPEIKSETDNVNDSDSDAQKLKTKDASINSADEFCDQTATLQPEIKSETDNANDFNSDIQKLEMKEASGDSATELCDQTALLQQKDGSSSGKAENSNSEIQKLDTKDVSDDCVSDVPSVKDSFKTNTMAYDELSNVKDTPESFTNSLDCVSSQNLNEMSPTTKLEQKTENLVDIHNSILQCGDSEVGTPNKSILDQYIPDMIPSSMSNISSCANTVNNLLDDQTVGMLPQNGSSITHISSNSDFNAPLPIAMSDSELVQGMGLSGSFVEPSMSLSQSSAGLAGNEDFMSHAAMMDTLTKEEEEEMIKTLSKPMYPIPMVPIPREPDVDQFQRNVIDHVEDMQDELEHRLDILEAQVEILEMEFDSQPSEKSSPKNDGISKVKRTIKKFLRDMEKLKNLTQL